jgi:hypothetical protein
MKETILEKKLKKLLDDAKAEACFVFCIPKRGGVIVFSKGLCSHDLAELSKNIKMEAVLAAKEEKKHNK